MKIEVMNKSMIEAYSKKCNIDSAIVISIYSHGNYMANIIKNNTNNIVGLLFLEFNDTDNKYSELGMKYRHARVIDVFVREHIAANDFDKIIVQCEAGQSRSAGVAAALMKYFNNDDTPIFNNPRYTPNMLCYRLTLEVLMEQENKSNC